MNASDIEQWAAERTALVLAAVGNADLPLTLTEVMAAVRAAYALGYVEALEDEPVMDAAARADALYAMLPLHG